MTAARKSARKPKPEPVRIQVTFSAGPVSMAVEVPASKVSATLDAMIKVHRRAVKTWPELIPELTPVTSTMAIDATDDDGYEDRGRKRAGFLS